MTSAWLPHRVSARASPSVPKTVPVAITAAANTEDAIPVRRMKSLESPLMCPSSSDAGRIRWPTPESYGVPGAGELQSVTLHEGLIPGRKKLTGP